jgi:hypothetical protein
LIVNGREESRRNLPSLEDVCANQMATNAGWVEFEKPIEAVRKQAANRIV